MSGRRHYLIDTENVQGRWEEILPNCRPGDAVTLFVSDKTSALRPMALGKANSRGVSFRFRACANGSPNAMDFQLSAELGRLSVQEPDTQFVIMTGDMGYRPLIGYMAAHGVHVSITPPGITSGPDKKNVQDGVRDEYERQLKKAGISDPEELRAVTAILYASMAEGQAVRKLSVLNRLRSKYGDAAGREKYAAIKHIVHAVAVDGPFPEKSAEAAARKKMDALNVTASKVNVALGKAGVTLRAGDVAKATQAVNAAREAENPAVDLAKRVACMYADISQRNRALAALSPLL